MPATADQILAALQQLLAPSPDGNLVTVGGTRKTQVGTTQILPALIIPAGETVPVTVSGQFIYPVIATGPVVIKGTPGGIESTLIQGVGIDFGLDNQYTSFSAHNPGTVSITVIFAIGSGRIIDNRLVANIQAYLTATSTSVINPAVIIPVAFDGGLNDASSDILDRSGTTVTRRIGGSNRQVFLQNRRALLLSSNFSAGLSGPMVVNDHFGTTLWQASSQFLSIRLEFCGDLQVVGTANDVYMTEIYDGIITG